MQKNTGIFLVALATALSSPAWAVDTVTSATVSSTVASSSNTVASSSGNTVVDKATTAATASSPGIVINNSDICVTGVSGAVQTSLFGVSSGGTIRDLNCERLKIGRFLFGSGLKIAAVSLLCEDRRVFDAMLQAGTPCPFRGLIGDKAKKLWAENPQLSPEGSRVRKDAAEAKVAKRQAELKAIPETPDDFHMDREGR
jgi:hypothetical protein|tara:strand:- start:56 stop:652 length:597 start_codon:yes stop_codon:yes gene_type:complete